MTADALATLGVRASAGIVLTPKLEYSISSTRRVDIAASVLNYGISNTIVLEIP